MKGCPICKQELISDAEAPDYCTLCGMPLPTETMVIKNDWQKRRAFCCKECKTSYDALRAN